MRKNTKYEMLCQHILGLVFTLRFYFKLAILALISFEVENKFFHINLFIYHLCFDITIFSDLLT